MSRSAAALNWGPRQVGDVPFVRSDGGRAGAGFDGRTGDCVCRAVSIAADIPYTKVHAALKALSQNERIGKRQTCRSDPESGIYSQTLRRYMKSIGWHWVPTLRIGAVRRVRLCPQELPAGRLVVQVSRHTCAVINGVIYDTYDPAKRGLRCDPGYWIKGESA